MSYEVIPTPNFEKELKRLHRKYPSLRADLAQLVSELRKKPQLGSEIYKNCYKIRFAITSKGSGKRGGGRLITHVKVVDKCVFLLSIYDKSETTTVTDSHLKQLLQDLK